MEEEILNEPESVENIENEDAIIDNENNELELEAEVEKQKKVSLERLNQLKYLQADFDNYRKQFEKEKQSIIRLANESLVKELIVILDDFENSIKLMKDNESKEGIQLIYKKFYGILAKNGLKEIESLGKKLDPEYHEVLLKEKSEKDDNEITAEIQKGYLLNSKVIRPTKVKISEKFKNDSNEIKSGENI